MSKHGVRANESSVDGNDTRTGTRKALLVLGMHRSGTSALAGVFAHLGARPPKSLLEKTAWNPKGYWESEKFKLYNDRLLEHVGSSWCNWSALAPAWQEGLLESAFSEELLATIDCEFGNADLLVVKDPRICLLAPFWVANLRRMEIEPVAVLPLRNPLEVASSLAQRNNFPIGTSLLLWLRHSLDAELATRDMPRSFQRYDDLLNDWRDIARRVARDLNLDWPDWSTESERQIDDFIARDLRHHRSSHEKLEENELVAGWVGTTYRYLSALVDGADDSEDIRRGLDVVREEFDRTPAIFMSISEFYERQEEEQRLEAWKLKGVISSKTSEVANVRAHQLNVYRRLGLQKEIADNEKVRREEAEKIIYKYRFMIGVMDSITRAQRKVVDRILRIVFFPWRGRRKRPQPSVVDVNALIREAGVFNDEWYIEKYPDVLETGVEPLTHYLQFGVRDERNPNPYFDTRWYLRKYPDVAAAGVNPLLHFVSIGAIEDRDPGPDFSTLDYFIQHPELVLSQINPLGHFLAHQKDCDGNNKT